MVNDQYDYNSDDDEGSLSKRDSNGYDERYRLDNSDLHPNYNNDSYQSQDKSELPMPNVHVKSSAQEIVANSDQISELKDLLVDLVDVFRKASEEITDDQPTNLQSSPDLSAMNDQLNNLSNQNKDILDKLDLLNSRFNDLSDSVNNQTASIQNMSAPVVPEPAMDISPNQSLPVEPANVVTSDNIAMPPENMSPQVPDVPMEPQVEPMQEIPSIENSAPVEEPMMDSQDEPVMPQAPEIPQAPEFSGQDQNISDGETEPLPPPIMDAGVQESNDMPPAPDINTESVAPEIPVAEPNLGQVESESPNVGDIPPGPSMDEQAMPPPPADESQPAEAIAPDANPLASEIDPTIPDVPLTADGSPGEAPNPFAEASANADAPMPPPASNTIESPNLAPPPAQENVGTSKKKKGLFGF